MSPALLRIAGAICYAFRRLCSSWRRGTLPLSVVLLAMSAVTKTLNGAKLVLQGLSIILAIKYAFI